MKKYLIIALLAVGCASSPPPVSTAPVPQEEATNPYTGIVGLLEILIDYSPAQFADFCGKISGVYAYDAEGYHTCSRSDGEGQTAGFALEFDGVNPSPMAVLIVPASEGQALANAVSEEVGVPEAVEGNLAIWNYGAYAIIFTPIPGGGWLLGLERAGTSL